LSSPCETIGEEYGEVAAPCLLVFLCFNLSQSLNIQRAEGIPYPRADNNRWQNHFHVSSICVRSVLSFGYKLNPVHLEKEENVSLLHYLLESAQQLWAQEPLWYPAEEAESEKPAPAAAEEDVRGLLRLAHIA